MPAVRLLFQDRAILAVLNFLRDTKAGRMVALAPPEKRKREGLEVELWPGEEGQGECAGDGGPGPP